MRMQAKQSGKGHNQQRYPAAGVCKSRYVKSVLRRLTCGGKVLSRAAHFTGWGHRQEAGLVSCGPLHRVMVWIVHGGHRESSDFMYCYMGKSKESVYTLGRGILPHNE
jgi:hypothetical protein